MYSSEHTASALKQTRDPQQPKSTHTNITSVDEIIQPAYAFPSTKMRTYEDTFSGDKIYPGKVSVLPFWSPQVPFSSCDSRDSLKNQSLTVGFTLQGKLYVRGDSKIFRFQNGKSESLFLQRKNPRRIAWTVLYRRQHKKGISEVSAREAQGRPIFSLIASSIHYSALIPSNPYANHFPSFPRHRKSPKNALAARSSNSVVLSAPPLT